MAEPPTVTPCSNACGPLLDLEKLTVLGEIVDDSKRLVLAKAHISKEDGSVAARAEGKTFKVQRHGER